MAESTAETVAEHPSYTGEAEHIGVTDVAWLIQELSSTQKVPVYGDLEDKVTVIVTDDEFGGEYGRRSIITIDEAGFLVETRSESPSVANINVQWIPPLNMVDQLTQVAESSDSNNG